MPSIYKYIPAQYVESFLDGAVRFASLAYYRDWEDKEKAVRGDRHEGTRLHQKPGGLELVLNDDPHSTNLQGSFQSRAQQDDIFVFCLSTVLSAELAAAFETAMCIEIHTPSYLLNRIQNLLNRRPSVKDKTLLADPVRYYYAGADVGVDWALPDVITMSKTDDYAWQQEYRLAYALKNAFAVGNTRQAFVLQDGIWETTPAKYPFRSLNVGDLRPCCTVWEIGPDGVPLIRI